MNILSDIFDAGLQALGIHVATGCNGHILFMWCLGYSVIASIYFRQWSWGAFLAAVFVAIGGNVLRILALIPLAKLPCFGLVHDLFGWLVSGIAFLLIVEVFEPRRATAVWLGRAICCILILWGVLFALAHAFPVPSGPSGSAETPCPKSKHTGETFHE